jgi:hypothetical protein
VVELGETDVDPDAPTEPMPLFMETLVAFDVAQLSVEEPPAPMLEGIALNDVITGAAVTVTVVCSVSWPLGPVAVIV